MNDNKDVTLNEKECQLITKCLEILADQRGQDVLGLFLKETKSKDWDDDDLCDLTKKLTKIYPYRGM